MFRFCQTTPVHAKTKCVMNAKHVTPFYLTALFFGISLYIDILNSTEKSLGGLCLLYNCSIEQFFVGKPWQPLGVCTVTLGRANRTVAVMAGDRTQCKKWSEFSQLS